MRAELKWAEGNLGFDPIANPPPHATFAFKAAAKAATSEQAILPLLEAVVQSDKPSTTGIRGSFVRRTGHLDLTALEGTPQTPFSQFV